MTVGWAEWLVCANCAGRVSEGRCAVCRDRLARMRREGGPVAGSAMLFALLLALLAVALVVARPA
ncbi:hypothetical protein [Streptomyces sp. ST2-7A]|uniref:hypothetical protein n=1 Tax=Streptomyces sp. ST2-7A TaxID=2907214 RepID=UPI001F1FD2B2|nr:hypothetical protein [Streptomyces sp. ST2-7A]MCE7082399.1 hypothetical protein [Streptomyces sp. ST2-7A]